MGPTGHGRFEAPEDVVVFRRLCRFLIVMVLIRAALAVPLLLIRAPKCWTVSDQNLQRTTRDETGVAAAERR